MAKGITIQISGLKELQKKLKQLPQDLIDDVDMVMANGANDYVNRAASAAPVDTGILKRSIKQKKLAPMQYEVVSAANYSAYVEFGTRSRVSVPAGLEAYAAQFKRGNSKVGGCPAQPFFFPQREPIKQQINKDLKQVVSKRVSK